MDRPLYLLLDTNVWVDYFLGSRPRNKETVAFLNKAFTCGAVLLYSVASARDVAFFVESNLKRYSRELNDGVLDEPAVLAAKETAWACLEHLEKLATAVGCDQNDISYAHIVRNLHGDFEDNLILAAANRAQANLLVTNDVKLALHAPVPAMNITDAVRYLETLEAQQEKNEDGHP